MSILLTDVDVDVIPCRDALDSIPDHGAHHRKPGVVCPGTFLHEHDLPDRAAAYAMFARLADFAGLDWPTMANSVAAVIAGAEL